jgi:hypothetical protein
MEHQRFLKYGCDGVPSKDTWARFPGENYFWRVELGAAVVALIEGALVV